ncbi:amidase domain-containing protein, partial [Lentilactobacillus buchneri]
YSHFWQGGDCTNWASQDRLHAGGRMTSSQKHAKKHFWSGNRISTKRSKWYCKRMKSTFFGARKHWNYSTSWTTVNGFYRYWTKTKHRPHFTTTSFRRVMAHVHVGDVVQLHSKKDGWHHTVTISKVTKHMVYYTSQNKNRIFAPLTKIKSLTGLSRTNKMRVIEMGI